KFTVIVNGSFGAGNYGMCGRAFDPRLLFMWPQGQISVMGGEQAAGVLSEIKVKQLEREGRTLSSAQVAAIREPILEENTARPVERLLQHLGALGRRPTRPHRHPQRARHRHHLLAQRSDRAARLRGLPVLTKLAEIERTRRK